MPNKPTDNPTYEDLAQAWGIDRAEIEKARKSASAQLVEGEHFTRDLDSGGALRFSPAGQVILADEIGLSLACDFPLSGGNDGPPVEDMAQELGIAMAEQMARPAAVAFFERFPAAVAAQVRRMVNNPEPEEMPLVYGAMQLAFGAATDPKRLPAMGQGGN
jgi:hypothetical protein